MVDWFMETASSGTMLLAIPVAVIAGLVSFFSPCVLPLLPGYVSYATGLSAVDLAEGKASTRRGRMLAGTGLFVLGFSVVFVLMGSAAGALGWFLATHRREFSIVLGVLSIVLGLVFMGAIGFLQREWRIHAVPAVGLGAAPLLGFLFGVGWMPCTGPTLGVISTLAATEGSPGRGALLSAFYALGLGIPFLIAGLAYDRMLGATSWVRRHQVWVMRAGGAMMIAVGILLITGWWDYATTWLQIHLIGSFEVAV